MSDLHGQIMNIRCSPADYMNADMRHIYRVGHRDARHAAAELVATHEAETKRAVLVQHGLLPCPFCGGPAQQVFQLVGCLKCETAVKSVEHWNRRVVPTPSVQPATLRFPTMLRKMWSGSEVQDWLDKQGPLYAIPQTPGIEG